MTAYRLDQINRREKILYCLVAGLFFFFGIISHAFAERSPGGTGFSSDQQKLIDEFGLPQYYQVFFIDEEAEAGMPAMTQETWFYDQSLTSYTFSNGAFTGSEMIAEPVGASDPPRLPPHHVHRKMTWEHVRTALGNPEFALYRLDSSGLGLENEMNVTVSMYFTERAVAGFDDRGLFMLMTIPSIPPVPERGAGP